MVNLNLDLRKDEAFKHLDRQVGDLRLCVRELVAELTIRRLPERRLRNLRQEWILSLVRGESNITFGSVNIDEIPLSDGSTHPSVWFQPPAGIPAAPAFFVIADDTDPEILLANRIECVLCIAEAVGWAPTRVLLHIEACANPLERLAVEASD